MLFIGERESSEYFIDDIVLRDKWSHKFEKPIVDYIDYFVDYVYHEKGRPCRRDAENILFYGLKYVSFFLYSIIPLLEGDKEKETMISLGFTKNCLESIKKFETDNKTIIDKKKVLVDFFNTNCYLINYETSYVGPNYIFVPGKKRYGLSDKGQEHVILLEKESVSK